MDRAQPRCGEKSQQSILGLGSLSARCAEKSWIETHTALERIPAMVEVEMVRPDMHDLTQQLTTLDTKVETFRSTLESYQAGRGERFAISSAKAGWTAAAIALLAMIVTIAIAVTSG